MEEHSEPIHSQLQASAKTIFSLSRGTYYGECDANGGENSMVQIIGRGLASATGEYWTMFASYLGAIGAFFSGSNTVSNLTFGAVQYSVANATGISVPLILALQSVGGAMGNMVCINNIIAVCSVLGIDKAEGRIIKTTAVPMFIYGVIAALVAYLVIPLLF